MHRRKLILSRMNDIRCSFSGTNMACLEFTKMPIQILGGFTANCFPAVFQPAIKYFGSFSAYKNKIQFFRITVWGVYFHQKCSDGQRKDKARALATICPLCSCYCFDTLAGWQEGHLAIKTCSSNP